MQQIIPLTQLISRASAVGLKEGALAKRSGVAISTVFRLFSRGSCNTGTLEKLSAVVLEEEARLSDHLGKLEGAA
jgi:hypothetical protein